MTNNPHLHLGLCFLQDNINPLEWSFTNGLSCKPYLNGQRIASGMKKKPNLYQRKKKQEKRRNEKTLYLQHRSRCKVIFNNFIFLNPHIFNRLNFIIIHSFFYFYVNNEKPKKQSLTTCRCCCCCLTNKLLKISYK